MITYSTQTQDPFLKYKLEDNGITDNFCILDDTKIVDDTDFMPSINEARLFMASGSGTRTPLYDFPDGKDNGLNLTMLRNNADPTEIDQAIKVMKQQKDIDIDKASEVLKEELKIAEQSKNESSSNESTQDTK